MAARALPPAGRDAGRAGRISLSCQEIVPTHFPPWPCSKSVDQNTPASARLRAADLVLTHGAKAIEIEDVEARVSELERAAEEGKNKR